MVSVLISNGEGAALRGHGHHLPFPHLDSQWPPPVRLSIHSSLQAFFTETLGSFFPSTMMNTVLTSVLKWNWGVDRGQGQPQREQINGVFFMFLSLCLSLFSLSSEGANWFTPGDSSFSFAKKNPLLSSPLWAHCGQYSNWWTQLKKDKYLIKKQRLQKIPKM